VDSLGALDADLAAGFLAANPELAEFDEPAVAAKKGDRSAKKAKLPLPTHTSNATAKEAPEPEKKCRARAGSPAIAAGESAAAEGESPVKPRAKSAPGARAPTAAFEAGADPVLKKLTADPAAGAGARAPATRKKASKAAESAARVESPVPPKKKKGRKADTDPAAPVEAPVPPK
jgi:hypothetical protein